MVLFSDNCSTIVNPDDICGSRFVNSDEGEYYEIHLYLSGDYTDPIILEYAKFSVADEDYRQLSCMLLDRG